MTSQRSTFLSLCPAEPFRIFFPLATLLGISGVSLWPLFFSGVHPFYPGPMHARLMIEGFLAGFVIGFLGTAMPRLLSAPPLRRAELWTLLTLYLLTAGLHIGHQSRAGDLSFIALMLCFGGCMIARVRHRAELPPPGFALVAFGYLSGLLGPVLWLCGVQGWVSGNVMMFGAMLLNQGFVLFPLLGIGTFLLPRFLRLRDLRTMTEERKASPGWWLRAAFSCATGLALLGSFWLEASDPATPAAAWLRAIAATAYLAAMIPFHRQALPPRTASLAAQTALLALVAGLIFPLFWPGQRVAGLHIVFLGGFSLITFTVATRVVLGHSGNEALFETRLPSLQIATLLLLAGALLRVVGDFSVERPHWLSAASYSWMLAAGVWGFAVLPKVRIADSSGDASCSVRAELQESPP
ncbi:MAG TPA: NnrS family protein [Chthoniobacteraceae bacterium]|nr:NnrS family protein [Chthoniobacteraceae bacterium]